MLIPIVTNLIVTAYLFSAKGSGSDSQGYALGAVLSFVYIICLIYQAKKILTSSTMALLKVFAIGFVVKLAALLGSVFVVWKTAPRFSINYFVAAFLWVLLLASVMEIVFYYFTLKSGNSGGKA